MFAYPTLADAELAAPVIWAEVSGQSPPVADVLNAAYTIIGYGLSKGFPASTPSVRPKDDLHALLQPIFGLPPGTILKNIPWAQLFALLLQLMQGKLTGGVAVP